MARLILFKHTNNFFHKLYQRKYYESNVGIVDSCKLWICGSPRKVEIIYVYTDPIVLLYKKEKKIQVFLKERIKSSELIF